MSYHDLIEQLREQGEFRPASADDLNKLTRLGVPEEILEFYRNYEPHEFDGQVNLLSICELLEQNEYAYPAFVAWPKGYLVFACTDCGDSYFFDLNRSKEGRVPIVLISHEIPEEVFEKGGGHMKVAEDREDFLKKLIANDLDDE